MIVVMFFSSNYKCQIVPVLLKVGFWDAQESLWGIPEGPQEKGESMRKKKFEKNKYISNISVHHQLPGYFKNLNYLILCPIIVPIKAVDNFSLLKVK